MDTCLQLLTPEPECCLQLIHRLDKLVEALNPHWESWQLFAEAQMCCFVERTHGDLAMSEVHLGLVAHGVDFLSYLDLIGFAAALVPDAG